MRFFRPSLLVFVLFPGLAAAEGRFALVLGAESYDYIRDLQNPVADATAIASLLGEMGFDVTLETDRDARRTRRALEDFVEDAEGADLALVYYAGHGTEVQGENYLLPTDAAVDTPQALADTAVPLSEVVAMVMSTAPAAILMIDACRDDPFAGTPLAGLSRGAEALNGTGGATEIAPGFARVGRADGLVYAFASAPGATASDGDSGHSPFADALLRHLPKSGLDVRTVLTLVSQDVYDRTRKDQLPYFESALPDLVFVAGQPVKMSERDALLLAMADLSDGTRAEVEALASARDMPLAPLFAALLTLDSKSASQEDRTRALIEAADAYADLQENLALLSPADPRVAALRAAAEADLDLGQNAAAQDKFRQAVSLDNASRGAGKDLYLTRTLSQADTLRLSADGARLNLDYDTAIIALSEAAALYAEIAPLGLPTETQMKRTGTLWDLGDLQALIGNTDAALETYRAWNVVAQSLSDAEPDDAALSRDLSFSYAKIGDVLGAQGDLAGAEAAHRAALMIAERLVARDPDNAKWQRDLSLNHNRIGDLLVAKGDISGAEGAYRAALTIVEELAARATDNADAQSDLWVSQSKIGDVLVARGDLENAEDAYRKALDIAQQLARRDPQNSELQRNLSVGYERIGDILMAQGELTGAEAAYRAGLAISETLAARDPNNAGWQRDLLISNYKMGDIKLSSGDLSGAEAAYRASLAIAEGLVARDPENAGWQRDLSVSLSRIGAILLGQGNLAGAEAAQRASVGIAERLVARDPANAGWQRDLLVSTDRLGDALVAKGDLDGAEAAYRAALAISERLVALDNMSAEAALGLITVHFKLAGITPDPRRDLEAALSFLLTLQSEGRLPAEMVAWIGVFEQAISALPPL